MTEWSKPCRVMQKLIEDVPGEHRYVFNCTFCQRDISEEWAERRRKRSDPQAALNLDLCPLRKRDVAKKFFTIGYGGTEPGQLISILKENGVEAVVDVRLWPHRASMGSYPEFGLVQHGRIYDVHARCAVSGFSPSHDI